MAGGEEDLDSKKEMRARAILASPHVITHWDDGLSAFVWKSRRGAELTVAERRKLMGKSPTPRLPFHPPLSISPT